MTLRVMDLETNIFPPYPGQTGKDSCFALNFDRLLKSPKFRHACEGRHPKIFENTGFPPSRE
jgi:hypothetical protein